jgi:DNA-binding LytR/AlgR family response regulator
MKVLIVDDEPLARERLAFALRDMANVELVGEAADGVEAAEKIALLAPDLLITDIQMPGRTGLAVAAELTGAHRPEVVFVTAHEQFAPDAFDVEAIDYLIKPVRFDRLRQAVTRARRRRAERAALADAVGPELPTGDVLAATNDVIIVPDSRGDRHVAVQLIDWVEAAKDYVLLHTAQRSHMVRMTMAELERRFDPREMLRVHRSAIVRRGAIRSVERPGRGAIIIELADGVKVPVGPSYLRLVAAALDN